LVGTARTQFLTDPCFYRGLDRIRFKGPPHFYEEAFFIATDRYKNG